MGNRTKENLKAAFAGESMARNKYTFFASVAKKAGYLGIAEYFIETANNEKEHAEKLLKMLGEIGDTKANLQAAIQGETDEYKCMYPEFARIAREEGELEAAALFDALGKVEDHHAKRYQALLDALEQGTLLKKDQAVDWVCRECGYIWNGTEPPDKCPLCKHEKEYYKLLCESI